MECDKMIGRRLRIYAMSMRAMEIAAEQSEVCVLRDDPISRLPNLKGAESFLISKPPKFKEFWIDPKEPVFDEHKHMLTCHKNRKKRKRKRK